MSHQVETFEIMGWEDPETGLVCAENQDWILIRHVPVDYVVDGYKLIRKSAVEERINGEMERTVERVLSLKGIEPEVPDGISLTNLKELLPKLEEKFEVFQIQDDEQDALYIGNIQKIEGNTLFLDFIDEDGEVDTEYEYDFDIDSILVVTFETDYVKSIRLLWKDNEN